MIKPGRNVQFCIKYDKLIFLTSLFEIRIAFTSKKVITTQLFVNKFLPILLLHILQ